MDKDNINDLRKNEIVYCTRIIPNVGIYEVCELRIRTVRDTYFVGLDEHDKHACLFSEEHLDKLVFKEKKDALKAVKELKKNGKGD